MKSFDINLNPVNFKDGDEARQFSAYSAKLTQILQRITDELGVVKIVSSAPTASELQELLSKSETIIVHHATSSNRKIWYKYNGTIYSINST